MFNITTSSLLLLTIMALPVVVYGGDLPKIDVTVSVTVVRPACEINNGQPVTIEFGDALSVNRLDGQTYKQPISYTLNCNGDVSGSTGLQMVIIGDAAAFNSDAIVTSKENLGIKILYNGNDYVPGDWKSFTLANQPYIEAVPVSNVSREPDTGEFTASATMEVAYQ